MVGFVTAPTIAWGTGALEQLSGLGAQRPVLVVDTNVAAQEGPRRAAEELERAGASVITVPAPAEANRLSAVATLAAQLRAHDADWVVVVGGGTAIDAAKAARLLRERPELSLGSPPADAAIPANSRSHLVAIPTTSGSGAEASWTADLVGDDGAPIEIADRSLVPEWAIVDPLFARELSAPALIAGALETAALATEAYVSAWANPFSDALAVDAVRTVAARLPRAVRWSDDPDARAALHYAATAAGIAQSNAQRGLAHALGRALVRPLRLSYATVLGVVLPVVLDFDRPGARERLEALATVLRVRRRRPRSRSPTASAGSAPGSAPRPPSPRREGTGARCGRTERASSPRRCGRPPCSRTRGSRPPRTSASSSTRSPARRPAPAARLPAASGRR